MLPTAADELPNVPPRLPIPASCLPLVSTGSEPEVDDTGKPVDGTGVDPNLKKEVVGDDDAITVVEELLLLDAITGGAPVVMLVLLEAAVALMLLLLVARDELLNMFGLLKLFVTKGGTEEENEGIEATGPLF